MGRVSRVEAGNTVYHILNRANFRAKLFSKKEHYKSFVDIIHETLDIVPMRILAYCLMPNHWHFILYPREDGDLSKFMQRITLTHTQRYHSKTKTIGFGHIYQGRYKSFPIQQDDYLLTAIRYVERNAKRAALVNKAENWLWSSAHTRLYGDEGQKKILSAWPIDTPDNYLDWLNQSQPKEEIENIRIALKRSRPYGQDDWVNKIVSGFGLEMAMRSRGRPRKGT